MIFPQAVVGRAARELRPDTQNAVFDSRVGTTNYWSTVMCNLDIYLDIFLDSFFNIFLDIFLDIFFDIFFYIFFYIFLYIFLYIFQVLSKHQATLTYNKGEFLLRDSGSSNGSFINNFRCYFILTLS